ncbi:MAG: ComF family protein, partial [bacterium]|nr:ComF family protein [bacterium]
MKQYLNIILNSIFPLKCEVCRQTLPLAAGSRICPDCRDKVLAIGNYYCQKCGKSLQIDTAFCVDCAGRDTLYYDRIRSAGIYYGVLREAIQAFKYNQRSCLGRELGEFMYGSYQQHFPGTGLDILVPVPMHHKQFAKRQYNQSAVLAAHLSQATGIPSVPKILARIRETRPQYTLNKQERAENIKHAFQVKDGAQLPGAKVLVIDDICTTG